MLRLRRPQSVDDDVGNPLGTRVVVALHRLAPDHECLDLGHVDVAAHGPGTLRGSRVVTVSSIGHRIRAGIHFDDLQWERSYSRVGAYGQSKLANLLFTYELQRRLAPHGTTIAAAAHPGGSRTELTRNLPALLAPVVSVLEPLFQGADMGALPTLRAATDPGVLGGQYYGPDRFGEQRGYPKVVGSSDKSHDVDVQRRLWAVSEELTGVVYPVD
jgi:NAD(P)-dependent dehydrogenase (short-subunit alcohol dehydrogenase family)